VTPDAKADLYSLAATLFRLVSGQPPHFHRLIDRNRHKSSRADLDRLRFQWVDSTLDCDLSDLRPEVPWLLSHLICRTLHPDPGQRPESAEALRKELEDIRYKFTQIARIERNLKSFIDIILEAVRTVFMEDTFAVDDVWENADAIRKMFRRSLPQLEMLEKLGKPKAIAYWAGIPAASSLLPRTAKQVLQVKTLNDQIQRFLDENPASKDVKKTRVLSDLVNRTMEGVRATCVTSVTILNEWRSLMHLLGIGR
jgi:serine/threonine protein kinase